MMIWIALLLISPFVFYLFIRFKEWYFEHHTEVSKELAENQQWLSEYHKGRK